MSAPEQGLLSTEPATQWQNALLCGNGRMGAMMLGQPLIETIILSHAGLFMPLHEPKPPPDTASRLKEIRGLLADGKFAEAAEVAVEEGTKVGIGRSDFTDPFIPAFDLKVEGDQRGQVLDYGRAVDFATGVASTVWRDDSGVMERRIFVSRAENVVVLSIRGRQDTPVTTRLRLAVRPKTGQGGWARSAQMFDEGIATATASAEGDWITYASRFRRSWPGALRGYEGVARIIRLGGSQRVEGDTIRVENADEVLVLLRVVLIAEGQPSAIEDLKTALGAIDLGFDALLRDHVALHGEIFGRTSLDLDGGAERRLSTEELIARSTVGNTPRALVEKQFDAARYILLSSTGVLPPTLTGIWIGTWHAEWSADYTHDGNVPTVLEGYLPLNMPELLLPYFDYVETQLPDYRENARRLFGARGIQLPSRSSSHGLNNHFSAEFCLTYWTAGAAWAAHFFYEYFRYTGDRDFLVNRALPFMKETALFYDDFLFAGDDGRLVFSPSYSPENTPANMPEGTQACYNATMDVAIVRELLGNLIEASTLVKADADLVAHWRSQLAQLPDYQIAPDGQLKEWTTPELLDQSEHRHASHLYPLYYGMPDEIAARPELMDAFRKSVHLRMDFRRRNPDGEMAFGLVQLGNSLASMREAADTQLILDWLANWYWSSAMSTTHNKHDLFNVDICGGMPALLTRMLVDTEGDVVDLLPMLPSGWSSGRIAGILTRGGLSVDVEWRSGRLTRATIRSQAGGVVRLRTHGVVVSRDIPSGGTIVLDGRLHPSA
jgi:hypothetical protein